MLKLTNIDLLSAFSFHPDGANKSVPGDYLVLENQWAKVMIQTSPYEDEPGVFIVTGDLGPGTEFRTKDIGEAYTKALGVLALYSRGRF